MSILRKLAIILLMFGFAISANATTAHHRSRHKIVAAKTVKAKTKHSAKAVKHKKIDINTASAEKLQAVKGITPEMAEAIVAYRTQNGDFKSVNNLAKVDGIDKKLLKKISRHLTVPRYKKNK